jgi:hypothetical protein
MNGADRIHRIAPRLAKVSVHVAISYGLHAGANKALLASKTSNHAKREIVEAYRAETAMMTVVRLCALLDREDKNVSYQRVHDLLKLPDVVEDLVARVKRATVGFLSEQVEFKSRQGIADFGQAYSAIFNSPPGLHGRLVHFRNHGVAHLSETELTKRITHDELGFLVGKVMEMTNALGKFAPTEVVFHGDEAEEYADQAEELMMAALDIS